MTQFFPHLFFFSFFETCIYLVERKDPGISGSTNKTDSFSSFPAAAAAAAFITIGK
jgi:hypothetical protein